MAEEFRLQKAERFIAAAQSAFEHRHWEACASRAYYAVYHLVVALIVMRHAAMGRRPKRPVSEWHHIPVRNGFLILFSDRGFFFSTRDGADYADLLAMREAADYQDSRFDRRLARRALETAEKLASKMRDALERNLR